MDILNGKDAGLITISKDATVHQAVNLMREKDIEQLVITDQTGIIGSLTEIRVYSKLLENPDSKNDAVEKLMEKPFPVVEAHEPYTHIAKMINKENQAVIVKTPTGDYQIITKHDIIKALA
jgi:cystathionine beta-synthase